jgi:mRNA interferase RelE/StbE
MKITIRESAIKDLKKISEPYKSKIKKDILKLKDFPNVANIKRLTNFEPAYRLRIGDYRVLFDVSDGKIIVGRILHRKDSYK